MEELFNGEKVIEEFETMTMDAKRVQRETLKKILEENESAEYLRNLNLNGRTDPQSFKTCVPVVSHEDIEPYILRIANKEDNSDILTAKPFSSITTSSGTTQGKKKLIPFNEQYLEAKCQIVKTYFAYRNREFPIEANKKVLEFSYGSIPFKTKGGLNASPVTSHICRSSQYKNTMKAIQYQSCSPDEVITSPDFNQALYCHLLCGLIFYDEVQFVSSAFAYCIVQGLRTFEEVWQELCTDIRNGTLSSKINIHNIRDTMSKLLKPNPDLADLIHKKCSRLAKSNWYGLVPTLFPNVKYISGVMTGSMEPFLKKLRHYVADKLPLLNTNYGSSEGWIGVFIDPKSPPEMATYVVPPNVCYYEFIPLTLKETKSDKLEQIDSNTVGLTEVKVGQEYEILITSFAGLYRYRLGDVVKVMEFHNSTPKLKFMSRKNVLLSINTEKTTEKDLQIVVEEACKLLPTDDIKLELIDFTSYADLSTAPAHYVIFWELSCDYEKVINYDDIICECCNCMDKSLIDYGYTLGRNSNNIGPLELCIVKTGTFQKIQDHTVASGTSISQFKSPRCVSSTNHGVLEILYDNAVKSYYSTAF